jgi:ClpP class serine protease
MPRDLTSLATRYAGRPLLLTPRAATELANRVRAVDHGAAVREGRFSALVRKLSGGGRQPKAMDDDDGEGPDFGERAAYAPRYIGEADDHGFCWSLKDGVALMNIEGPLLDRGEYFCGEIYHGYDTILAALREASDDERVRGVFVRASTPGGVVGGGLPALAEWMRENGARAGGKPIHIYADMACSAGYWMAASADKIIAPRVGLVGSIGAVIVHENWAKALDEVGVEITPIQFGAKKTDGAWWGALSDSAREDLQAEIDQCGRDFVADVVAGRPQLSAEEVIATEARVFMGHHDAAERSALALKLVDAHASEEAAFAELRDMVAGSDSSSPNAPSGGSASSTRGAHASTPANGTSTAGAARGRASASAAQEAPVANKPKAGGKPSRAAAIAAAQAAVRKANAELARAQASAEETEDEDQVEGEAPAEDEMEAAAEESDDNAAPAAQAIAASAEAASHPAMALTAIKTGQSLAQFRANVKAAGSSGGANRLASTLGGAPRLGADGASGPKKRLSAREQAAKNSAAGRARG